MTTDKQTIRRTVWTIVTVNVWERYAFYTMFTLLPLFLTAEKAAGGFGWSLADALLFVGAYSGLIFSSPLIGGILADRWLGQPRALAIGTVVLMLGHVILGLPYLIPHVADWLSGREVAAFITGTKVPDGQWLGSEELHRSFIRAGGDPAMAGWSTTTHIATTAAFYLAVAGIIIGNGLFKPTITVLLGQLHFRSDGERDAAYSLLYMGRNLGAAAAGFIAGALGQKFGWHMAFTTAMVGMMIGLIVLARNWRRFYVPLFQTRQPDEKRDAEQHTAGPQRISSLIAAAFIVLLLSLILYSIAFDQLNGLGVILIEREVDRSLGGWLIPSTWLISLNPLFIIALTPFFINAWQNPASYLGRMNAFERFALAFAFNAGGFAFFLIAAIHANTAQISHWWIIVVAMFLLTIGDLFTGPIGEANIAKHAPLKVRNVAMGLWFTAAGVGGWLAGLVGAQAASAGYTTIFLGVTAGSLACAMLLVGIGQISRRIAARR